MRTLLTRQEVAELLGRSPRWVDMNRSRFNCEQASEPARNGQTPLLYHLSSLPPEAQQKWRKANKDKLVEMVSPPVQTPGQLALALSSPAGPNLSAEDQQAAERRYRVIEPLIQPEKHRAIWLQCLQQKGKVIEFLAKQHGVKRSTIYNWCKKWEDGGLPALIPKRRDDKGRPRVFNNAALDFIVAAVLPKCGAYGKLTGREIHRAYLEETEWRGRHVGQPLGEFELRKYSRYVDGEGRLLPDALLPSASYRTFSRWLNKIPDVVKVMAREGEEAFANTQEIISFRALAEVQPMDYLVLDHRQLDLFCLAPHRGGWRLVRPWLTAALDMRTRKWVATAIVESPSSDSIASVLKRAFLDYGLWKATYIDNGKDFRCEYLEGKRRRNGASYKVEQLADGIRGVMDTLGIRVHHSIVRRARAKIIEACFRATAEWDRSTPWWTGHRPTARPESLEKLIKQHERWMRGEAASTPFKTIGEIAALYNELIQTLNEREHKGEGMAKVTPTGRDWMCPNEAWEVLIPHVEVKRVPAEQLAFCFQKRKRLKVRHGELRPSFHGRQFHYRMAENPVQLMALNGREVGLGYDPFDLGTAAVYHEGRFLGLAHNAELRRMGEAAFVADEKNRRAARREVKRFINAVHEAVHVPDVAERAARRQAVRPARLPMAVGENTVAADIPAEVVAASEAARRAKEFNFADSEMTVDVVARQDHDDAEDEFSFFQDN